MRLSWDHHHGLVFALRIKRELAKADTNADQLFADLIAFWSAGLLPHFRVEGECLLARLLQQVPRTDASVQRTLTDHLGMASLVTAMRDSPDPAKRRDLLQEFGVTLQQHIRWEESVLFPLTEASLGEGELARLSDEIAASLPDLVPAPPEPSPGG